MKEFIKQVFTGVDGLPSSKRLLMLYTGILIVTFIIIAEVFIIKPFNAELWGTTKTYVFALVGGLAGFNVWERKINKSEEDKPTS